MIRILRQKGIKSLNVLNAMENIPRENFIPKAFEFQAYENKALPIGFDQTISHPYTVARMTELLDLSPDDKVLEIGTGSGYQSAVLAELGVKLYTIEIIPELAKNAKNKLNELGYRYIMYKTGDGSTGWPIYAPYDAIIVTAGAPVVPESLIEQLKISGRLIIPVGKKQNQKLKLIKKQKNQIINEEFDLLKFVPLIGKTGWRND